jgi:basic membrane lipoprotein Med (substrate-binding protein (PBP1-ABC) superfamily)
VSKFRISRKSLLYTLPLIAFALVGCGGGGNETKKEEGGKQAQTPAEGESSFKVALVTAGPVSDNGWNAGAYKSLLAIKSDLGVEVQNVQAGDPGAQEENLRSYASKKFNIVIGHGHEFEEPALKIEGEFPNTQFLISSGSKAGKNTTPLIIKLEDGAYLLGMAAAGVSKTGVLGSVGAMKIPVLERIFKSFELGAKAVNPNIKVIPPVYTGSWDDTVKAKEQTLTLITQNADVIMQDVDAGAAGVFNAVKEKNSAAKPLYALGTNSDQNAVAEDVVLASAPIYYDKMFIDLAKKIQKGGYTPSDKPFGMPEGAVGFVLNPKLASRISADAKTKLDTARREIMGRKLDVLKGS